MTYLLYAAWILSMVLAIGELDNLVARRILQWLKFPFPEVDWKISTFLSPFLPGLGQFLNGQPLKALFVAAWPFISLYNWPVPRPWPLWGLKTGLMLLPWWLIAIADALIVGWIRQRRQTAEQMAPREGLPANTVDYYAYLQKRQKREGSGS